jgi:hypothetical protein
MPQFQITIDQQVAGPSLDPASPSQREGTHSDFPHEVPRPSSPPVPEWAPGSPQEIPERTPQPSPDWSPSSAADPIIEDDNATPTKHDSPARPDDKHDLGDNPDGHTSPLVIEDPKPEPPLPENTAGTGQNDPHRPAQLVAGPPVSETQRTPSGRVMRPTAQEAYY